VIKEELIEQEKISREGKKGGDGKMSSESTEEKRIVIEDSMEGDSYVVRTVAAERCVQEGEEPVPPGEVLTPVNESTPVEGRGKGS